MISSGFHLSYCTNIHPGESWQEVFKNLKAFIPDIKKSLSPDAPFGIGLRLSNQASIDILQDDHLKVFKEWLEQNNCYVFTFNGFPYGGFHRQVVKDEVHRPDWSSGLRLEYTLRLFDILAFLIPNNVDGGISTSPLSYKYWHDKSSIEDLKEKASINLAKVAAKLYEIRQNSSKDLHLDIEPEPDGLLENTQQVIDFYRDYLIPVGGAYLKDKLGLSSGQSEKVLKHHIRVCYDVCHFAVVYEQPQDVFSALAENNIKIGKIQISAALKLMLSGAKKDKEDIKALLAPFAESTYLHQVVARHKANKLSSFPDLPQALESLEESEAEEWRTHFHVPIFLANYGGLASTQEDIEDVLRIIGKEKVCNHLEVETYTWEVLPKDIQLDMKSSIIRELQWVKEKLDEDEKNRSN